ncbi:MAG TPA: caspase family protein [Kofleriaceae bacterium]
MELGDPARFHVLLIGIDAYPRRALHGAVNDIDAIQRILLDRAGVPEERITRLASPHPGATHDATVPSVPATAGHLRQALARLASAEVEAGDRVLIYFAGHGTQVATLAPDGSRRDRDALAPVDAFHAPDDARLVLDVELDAMLAAIAERTPDVTIVIDACHAAGAPRPGLEPPGERARYLRPPDGTAPIAGPAAPPRERVCQRVAACQPHQRAVETHEHDRCHGLLTRALVQALSAAPAGVTWGEIWQAVRAAIEERHPWQHARLAGTLARGVLGGPPVGGAAGLSVIRTADPAPRYRVAAGTLAGVTAGATLALYDRPRAFARLDSPDDLAARCGGLLRVESAGPGEVIAVPIDAGAAELPDGARARVVANGAPVRLRCALLPDDAALAAALAQSPLLEVVEPSRAQVWLVLAGGRWLVTDDVHGARSGEPILTAIGPHDLGQARRVLEHYHAYAAVLRLAARATELPGGLELAALAAPDRAPAAAEAVAADWPELAGSASGRCIAGPGARYCIRARNTSRSRLRVTLVAAASTGQVQLLGDQVVDADTAYVFWHRNQAGAPFTVSAQGSRPRTADRLIAIGRAALATDIGYLRLDAGFADILNPARTRDRPDSAAHKAVPAPEPWTAAQLVIEVRRDHLL